jgi:hypothetical protein
LRRLGGRFGLGLGRRGCRFGLGLGLRGGRIGPSSGAIGVDLGDRGADRDRLAIGDQDLRHLPRDLGGNLGIHLVSDDLEQRVVLLDGVALLDEPALDRALGDRLAQLGHLDRGSHRCRSSLSGRVVFVMSDCDRFGLRRRWIGEA